MTDLDDLDSKIFRISWQNINSGAHVIARNIEKEHDVEVIICKQNDVIVASIVARLLDLPLCIVQTTPRQNGIIIECVPKFSKPIRSGEYNQPQAKVAIVTTMVDDGHNVEDLKVLYNSNKPTVHTVYARANTTHPPDYHWVLIARGVNCIYPWEDK